MCLNRLFRVLLGACFLVSIGCGDDEATEDPITAITGGGSTSLGTGNLSAPFASLLVVPPAVGPVIAANSLRLTNIATTGLPFAPSAEGEFGGQYSSYVGSSNLSDFFPENTGSYAACETLNYARGAYGTVGNADMMNCFLGQIADGELENEVFKFYSLDYDDESIQFKVRRINAADGNLAALEVFTCFEGQQEEYFSVDFSGGNVEMYFKGTAEPENPQVDRVTYEATVTADGVSAEGFFTGTKNLSYRYRNLFNDGRNNHVVADIVQKPETFEYNGFSCEREDLSGLCDSHSQGFLSYSEILDRNDTGGKDPNKFALGDGAAHITSSSINGIQQWLGDSGVVDNSTLSDFGQYVQDNISDKITINSTFEDITFTEEQTWDCSDTAEPIAEADAEAALQICGIYSIDQNVHLECGGGGNANLSTDSFD